MSIPAFDYDGYWRDGDGVRDSSLWRERGLHWHCHLWRGNASECEDESARRDPSIEDSTAQDRRPGRMPDNHIRREPEVTHEGGEIARHAGKRHAAAGGTLGEAVPRKIGRHDREVLGEDRRSRWLREERMGPTCEVCCCCCCSCSSS